MSTNYLKNISIPKKLWLLSFVLVTNTVAVGLLSYWNSHSLVKELKELAVTQLPAVRNMTLADMMHDGIRAVVFHSIIVANTTKDEKEIADVRKELKEFSQNINEYLSTLATLDLVPETKKAIEASLPNVKLYVTSANELAEAALSGKPNEAVKKLPEFTELFEKLEKDLGLLGDLIESNAKRAQSRGELSASHADRMNTIFLFVGLIVGLTFAWWISRDLIRTLSELIEGLGHNSVALTNSANNMQISASDLSSTTSSQAAGIQETAASIEEINAMVTRSNDHAHHLESVVEKGESSTAKGKTSIGDMIQSINTISESNQAVQSQVNASNEQISEIVKVISEIGEKTRVINDIVFQTKLLSFNASVEAARAGEHGKGFAVVAEEVGNLAQMSGNAAKEISTMLADGIEKTNRIVTESKSKIEKLMTDTKNRVDAGVSVANDCGVAFDDISRQMTDVRETSSQIAVALQEQTRGIQEISKAIQLFNSGMQQNSVISTKTATTAQLLSTESKSLDTAVTRLSQLVLGSKAAGTHAVAKNESAEVTESNETEDLAA